ncbi:hypothetical protein [Arenimonas sp.]|uniref:hypothetical protein n=1 Tax=Arenimonas sp. TaxID=1872635 RepID=UPI002E34B652|nr:hypothetical protein [Arenimonas sp.]HEX4855010.1 hypothetical protein [Arenimonas sp.]
MPQTLPQCCPLRSRLRFGLLAALATGLACVGATASEAGSWTPDEATAAGIAACEAEAASSGLLASLCKNRRETVALIRLCDGFGDASTAMDAAMLARWDRRNAPYLRWVGEQAAKAASAPRPDEQWLWDPSAAEDGMVSLMSATFEDQFRSLSREEQAKLCAHSRRSIDGGAYDLQPPES